MSRITLIHRTPEDPDCPGRIHNTRHAAQHAGCVCHRAQMLYREHLDHIANMAAIRKGRPRSFEVDPKVVERAVRDGQVAFSSLTRAERKIVVWRLAVERGMSDIQIAVHLLWSPDKPNQTRRGNVAQYRRTRNIPAALPQPAGLAAGTDRHRAEVNAA